MPRSDYGDDEGSDSVDEDAELELSCALHDLAERVKTFEENMRGRLRISGIDCGDDVEEIGEDIPEVDEDHHCGYGYASPKKSAMRFHPRGQRRGDKQSKQQEDDEDSYEDEEDEDQADAKDECTRPANNAPLEWDEQGEREELSEIKYNISKLLQGFKEQAKALEADTVGANQ